LSPSPRLPDPQARHENLSTEAFWTFAKGCWDQPPARSRLLHWQDHHQIDVLLVLFACWLPDRLGTARWRRLAQGSEDWNRRITRRIRTLRRQLADMPWSEGYQACLALEQAAERVDAAWLTRTARPCRASTPSTRERAERLRRLFPLLPEAEIDRLLATLRR
jgi:uncharacterized protein (TIGR02444 family)